MVHGKMASFVLYSVAFWITVLPGMTQQLTKNGSGHNSPSIVSSKWISRQKCQLMKCHSEPATGKPDICTDSSGYTVPPDGVVNLTCRTSHPDGNVSLMVDGKPVNLGDFVVHKTGCVTVYTIKYNKPCYDMKKFSCYVSNAYGNATSRKKTNVEFYGSRRPEHVLKMYVGDASDGGENKRLIVGTTGKLTCECIGEKTCQKLLTLISFYIKGPNGTWLTADEGKYPRLEWTGGTRQRSLLIHNVTRGDAGTYGCDVFTENYKTCSIRTRKEITITTGWCKPGHYCTNSTWKDIPCPAGTYNDAENVFGKEGCLRCPAGSYCVKGSPQPLSCPVEQVFDSVNINQTFPLSPAKTGDDCRRCPLRTTCSGAGKCAFICGSGGVVSVTEGASVVLSCKVLLSSSQKEMNLKWKKDGKLLALDKYRINYDSNLFSLRIMRAVIGDKGKYECVGTYPEYGKTQVAFVTLDVSAKNKNRNKLLLILLLLLVIPLVFILRCILKKRFFSRLSGKCYGIPSSHESIERPLEVRAGGMASTNFAEPTNQQLTGNAIQSTKDNPDGTSAVYDAFVCYSNIDKDFVHNQLWPELEKRDIKLCLHFRDFKVGGLIIDNIMRAIENSRKTIAVLSPDFLASEWCNYELHNSIVTMKNHVVPVVYRSCRLPRELSHTTYVDWTDEDGQPYFWSRLVEAIHS